MPDALPTPRTTLAAGYVRVLVWCKACRREADADLAGLVDAGRGDVPLRSLRFQCSNCRSRICAACQFGMGMLAMHRIHAQARPPAYAISEIQVTNPEAYAKEYVPLANKALAESG